MGFEYNSGIWKRPNISYLVMVWFKVHLAVEPDKYKDVCVMVFVKCTVTLYGISWKGDIQKIFNYNYKIYWLVANLMR